jgi:hypothetical protein
VSGPGARIFVAASRVSHCQSLTLRDSRDWRHVGDSGISRSIGGLRTAPLGAARCCRRSGVVVTHNRKASQCSLQLSLPLRLSDRRLVLELLPCLRSQVILPGDHMTVDFLGRPNRSMTQAACVLFGSLKSPLSDDWPPRSDNRQKIPLAVPANARHECDDRTGDQQPVSSVMVPSPVLPSSTSRLERKAERLRADISVRL